MIYEYAVEPSVINEWCRDGWGKRIYDEFGLGTPRVVAGFPSKKTWKRNALQSLERLSVRQRAQAEEIIKKFSVKMTKRVEPKNYDDQSDWLNNSISENQRERFHIIISNSCCSKFENVISGSEFLRLQDERCIHPRSISTFLEAHELTTKIKNMLSNCSQLIIIDPYFKPETKEYQHAVKCLLNRMLINRGGPLPIRVEIQCSSNKNHSPS